MIKITISHRFNELITQLHYQLQTSAKSPFVPEEIIIPSQAMKRHLELALAKADGICANIRFSYLARWLWEQTHKIVPDISGTAYDKEQLVWRIFHILGNADFTEKQPRLFQWLKNNDEAGRFELAQKLADLFDQYMTYRPEWLENWWEGKSTVNKNKEDERWQAALWQKIEEGIESDKIHPFQHFFDILEKTPQAAKKLPERLSIFCLPSIAPEYIKALSRISQWVHIHIYILTPFIVTEKTKTHLQNDFSNSLLSIWGKQTQSHLHLLIKEMPKTKLHLTSDTGSFSDTLLGRLQKAILKQEELTLSTGQIKSDDRSIEIHVCHSLMREVEVLYDQMLAVFAGDNPPNPTDILVVTPHIDNIAPLVDAVFGSEKNKVKIPYRIAGRSTHQVNPAARALKDILSLAASRFTAADVYDLLLQPAISRRFGLESALDRIYLWLKDAGICWGIDAKQKETLNLPPDDSRSFADGFYRLFLAYALPQDTIEPFHSRLPAGHVEGTDAELLGNLWHFMQLIKTLSETLNQPQNAKAWRQILLEAVDHFIYPDPAELENDLEVRNRIGELFDQMEAVDCHTLISGEVIRLAVENALGDSSRVNTPFGAVTFSPMDGLRHLPYRFIFAIGMNNGVFPRDDNHANFNLIPHHPQTGDRNKREEDRNLFLDLLLAAKDRFYISYTGKSIRNNDDLPPSVMVSELLDYLEKSLKKEAQKNTDKEKNMLGQLIIEHPLQPYSIQYFEKNGDDRIKSYQSDYYLALKTKYSTKTDLPSLSFIHKENDIEEDEDEESIQHKGTLFFKEAVLSKPDPSWHQVSLSSLISFFENPCQFLLSNRMGIRFPIQQENLPSNEPFVEGNLEPVQLANRLLPFFLDNHDQNEILKIAKAGNEFPTGAMGELRIEKALENIQNFADRIKKDLEEPCLPSSDQPNQTLLFDLEQEKWELNGFFNDIRPNGLVRYRYVKEDGASGTRLMISAWISHLFMNAIKPQGVICKTSCHFNDGSIGFVPCKKEEAAAMLKDLLSLYCAGLRAPLHFFPNSARKYMEKGQLNAAQTAWKNERNNAFYQLALRGKDDILNQDFQSHAKTVMEPLNRFMERLDNDQ